MNKNNVVKWVAGVLALILVIAGAYFLYNKLSDKYMKPEESISSEESGVSSENNENLAPDFTVFDKDGNEVKLSDFKGKPVVVNFWATWCYYCKVEMPDFEAMYKKYGDDVHFMMINATDNVQETKRSAEKFIEKEGYTFPVYFDLKTDAVKTYGLTGFPASFFIDKDGNLVTSARGMIDTSNLEKGISMITE